ncbi:dynactin subunit 4 [Leptopilina heterotoma]|uniref:dynactin subunit 4 n=1 Tax=Leptopilina heterotoma TaxID=63436 RepID=UPI001CA98D75|nr:dynactin subunit 4 [Leptopilina heterotoma]
MAYLFQPEYVKYACSCGSLKPISKIYFCRHCLKIRCGYCVCQEVDSHYCPSCLEQLPTLEARIKKNKCFNCFDCPCCLQTLSVRAGHALIKQSSAAEDSKAPPKKVYYLFCSLCRWSSRDAGIPDQSIATGSWPEQENPNTNRINILIDYHKALATKEKQQRDRKKKHTFLQFEKFGLTSAMARKRVGRPPLPEPKYQESNRPTSALAIEKVEELPANIFTEPVDITKITTLEQRLHHPEVQAETINELRPQHKQFLVKRSQRCRACEHNVSKPDFSSHSTKFKIQLAAFYHVPEVRIVTCEPLRTGKTSELLLKFCNPTQHQSQIILFSVDTATTPTTVTITGEKVEVKRETMQLGTESPNLLPSAVRQMIVTEDPKPIKITPNAELTLPHSALILPPRDDAAEYDDTGDSHNFQDDPKLVVWRKGNKAVVRLLVTPNPSETNEAGNPVIIGFVMQYGYVNTIATLEHKAPQKLDLRAKLFLTVGNLHGST